MEMFLFFLFRPDGVVVPLGKQVDTGVNNPDGYTLNYNGKLFVEQYFAVFVRNCVFA